jgi:hypothetical protein
VFLDGDVYLTGSRNPFQDMLSLGNKTWDIQFQRDFQPPSPVLNIGWYFARATDATKEYFHRSYQQWLVTKAWDQAVMNEVAAQMEAAHRLRVHRLDLSLFRNYMLENAEASLFSTEEKAAQFIDESTMIHYTCVETNLKGYFGSTFAGSTDHNKLYSQPPPMIAVANITGTSRAIMHQLAFAMSVARETDRALIWPHSVFAIQQRPEDDITKHFIRPALPTIQVVNYAHAQTLGIDLLESRFLHNRQRHVSEAAATQQVLLDVVQQPPQELKQAILDQPLHTVPTLDFSALSDREKPWLRTTDEREGLYYEVTSTDYADYLAQVSSSFESLLKEIGIADFSKEMLSKLQMCGNADGNATCLAVCAS